jgi:hypothetical protein
MISAGSFSFAMPATLSASLMHMGRARGGSGVRRVQTCLKTVVDVLALVDPRRGRGPGPGSPTSYPPRRLAEESSRKPQVMAHLLGGSGGARSAWRRPASLANWMT